MPPPFDPRRPPYVVSFELASGRVIPAAVADSRLCAQVHVIQLVARVRATGGAAVVVLVQHPDGQVRERVVVTPNGSPEP